MARYQDPWTRPDLIDEAQRRTKQFVRKVHTLIQKTNFDIIIAAGNSGLMMTKLTKLTYKQLNLKMPLVVKIPIYLRDKRGVRNRFDNSVLIPAVKKQLSAVDKIENILFVDDELSEKDPKTFRESIKLIKTAGKDKVSTQLKVFVVAEGGELGELRRTKVLKCEIKYIPFAKQTKEWKGVTNFVAYEIPWSIKKQVLEVYSDDELSAAELFCTLIGEPIRIKGELRNGKPFFSNKFEILLKRDVKNFEGLQAEFEEHLVRLVNGAIRN